MPKRRFKLQYDLVFPRVEETRDFSLCVIAIEGEVTEKQYFQKFGAPRVKIDILPTLTGNSAEPEGIIERLRHYVATNDIKAEDKCWLVFDVDNRDHTRLTDVCKQAMDERFQVAISNPCFEFWLFLHRFDVSELHKSVHDAQPEKRSKEMKRVLEYRYSGLLYSEFQDDVNRAIRRATEINKGNKSKIPRFPGTTVYKLVTSLPIKPPTP